MPGRARLITGGKMLRGLRVNGFQRNPTAGVGMRGDVAPPAKRKKSKKKKKNRVTTQVVKKVKSLGKAHPCPTCGKFFWSAVSRNAHALSKHGIDASSVVPVTTTIRRQPIAQTPQEREPITTSSPADVGASGGVPATKPKVVCPICGEGLGKYQLLKHYRSAHSAIPAKGK